MSKLTEIQSKIAQEVALAMYGCRGTSAAARLEQTIESSEAVAELIEKAYAYGWNSAMRRTYVSITYKDDEL